MAEALRIELVSTAVLTVLVVAVSFFELRERRIPNFLVLPAAGLGLALNLYRGWEGLSFSAQGLATGFLLLFIPYLLGAMGAGDVKFLAAIGAFVGAVDVVRVLLVTVLCYPLLAVGIVLKEGKLKITLLRFGRVLLNFLGFFLPGLKLYAIRLAARDDPQIVSATTPFGVSVALGTLITLYTNFLR